jgi:hypothetical protein
MRPLGGAAVYVVLLLVAIAGVAWSLSLHSPGAAIGMALLVAIAAMGIAARRRGGF